MESRIWGLQKRESLKTQGKDPNMKDFRSLLALLTADNAWTSPIATEVTVPSHHCSQAQAPRQIYYNVPQSIRYRCDRLESRRTTLAGESDKKETEDLVARDPPHKTVSCIANVCDDT